MQRTTLIFGALLGLGAVGLAALTAQNWRLSRRVAALEMVAARSLTHAGDTPSHVTDVEAIEGAVAAWREARAGGGTMTEDEAVAMIEASLEDAMKRREEEKKTEQVDKYMKMAEEGMRVEVEDLADDYQLTEDQVNRTVDLLVQGMYEGYQLKEDIGAGAITVRQAKEEGEKIKAEYRDALIEVLGEPAYEALGEAFYGPNGWDAAR